MNDSCSFESSDKKAALGKLYDAYKEWSDNACQDIVGKKMFGNLMRQKGIHSVQERLRERYWNGIKLNPGVSSEEK